MVIHLKIHYQITVHVSWWFRELEGGPSSAWALLDPGTPVGVEDEKVV